MMQLIPGEAPHEKHFDTQAKDLVHPATADNDAKDGHAVSRMIKGSTQHKPPNMDGEGLAGILVHPLSLFLLCLPFGILAHYLEWGKIWTFWLIFFAMIPLAKILGDATEELAAGLRNDMLAGLLNATFGNVVELVLTVQTMREGLYDVVKATLLGSVLSNMLLVLGMSFFFGGIVASAHGKPKPIDSPDGKIVEMVNVSSIKMERSLSGEKEPVSYSAFQAEKVQRFGVLGALVNISMLLLSCLSFVIVTIFHTVTHVDGIPSTEQSLLPVSRICSLVMISSYGAYVFFQLGTHRTALADDEGEGDEEDEEEATLSLTAATVLLACTTCLVAFCSEILVEAIRGVTEAAHMSEHFIGIVLLPIIGNACEHAAAVRFAIRDKLGLSIGIAVGSSTQISLFAVPFSVLAGWMLHRPMDLDYGALNTSVMTVSVVVVLSMVVDGQSNWLQGYLLMCAYVVIAICYWHLPNELPELD
mmetsp:Transcript_15566/g.33820  ORF Transcript_15566/g.33820 Transcript_15566/m.33820 type:complete len:474 (+) Transcript_15566:474-1895(+)